MVYRTSCTVETQNFASLQSLQPLQPLPLLPSLSQLPPFANNRFGWENFPGGQRRDRKKDDLLLDAWMCGCME